MKERRLLVLIIIVFAVIGACVLSGCSSSKPVWGKGELPQDWKEMFGKDNNARLDFAQSNILNGQQVILFGRDAVDPNGVKIHEPGLIDYVAGLEKRITELEAKPEIEKADEFRDIKKKINEIIRSLEK